MTRAAPGLSTRQVLYWLAFFAGLAWCLYLFFNSPGSPVQDEIGHYLFSRSAWQYPVLALNLWGRSVNTIFYMPAALGGFSAARLFSIGAACLTVLLATRVAQKIGIKFLFLIPLFLWFQPWFADLSYAVINEIPSSLVLILGLYFALEDRPFPIEFITNDPTVKGMMDNLGIGPDEARGVASSIVSIKVSAVKP